MAINAATTLPGGGSATPSIETLWPVHRYHQATPTATTISNVGLLVPSATGNLATRAIVGTSVLGSTTRVGLTSASSVHSAATVRMNSFHLTRGSSAGAGGFRVELIFGIPNVKTTPKLWVGLFEVAPNSTLVPSTRTNCFFVGNDEGEANLSIMHNDVSGNCGTVSLGSNYPANVLGAMYRAVIIAEPNGSAISYEVYRLDTTFSTSGTVSTNLPQNTALLGPTIMRSNGATVETVDLDFVFMGVRTKS